MKLPIFLLFMAFSWEAFAQDIEKQSVILKFTSLDGKKIDLAELKGKVVLIDCWATWCGPCLKEMPHIKELYEKYRSKGFEVIGVSMDEEGVKQRTVNFLEKKGIQWPQRFEGKGFSSDTFSKAYNLKSLPTIFLLDKDGIIVDKDARGERLEPLIKKYLGI